MTMTTYRLAVFLLALLGAMAEANDGIPTYQICSPEMKEMQITPNYDLRVEMGANASASSNGSCSMTIRHAAFEYLLMQILSFNENCTNNYLDIFISDSLLPLIGGNDSVECGGLYWDGYSLNASEHIRLVYTFSGKSSTDGPDFVFLFSRFSVLDGNGCSTIEFACDNNRCINNQLICDGFNNCGDDSDEIRGCITTTPGSTTDTLCGFYRFICDNGNCIPSSYQCDGMDDCGDNSDENDCLSTHVPATNTVNGTKAYQICAPENQWRPISANTAILVEMTSNFSTDEICNLTIGCKSGQRLNVHIISYDVNCTDGHLDVRFTADDGPDLPPSTVGRVCGLPSWIEYSSAYTSDVFVRFTRTTNSSMVGQNFVLLITSYTRDLDKLCANGDFECDYDQSCISSSLQCDGYPNCYDNSEEVRGCQMIGTPTTTKIVCTQNQFRCDNGMCILSLWRCDGVNGCGDNSDEDGCIYPTIDPVCNTYSDQFRCDNGKCKPMSVKCDGTDDCGDDSDEYTCPDPTCSTYQFRCDNGDCKPMSFKCDGTNDCGDNSDEDEANCPVCHSYQFRCDNGNCISWSYKCDHADDCGDNSDEYNCPGCGSSQFKCTNGLCIDDFYTCDGIDNCLDNSDEDCVMTKGAIVGTAFGAGIFVFVIASLAVGGYYIRRRRRMLSQRGANMSAVSTVLPQATPPPYTLLQNPPIPTDYPSKC